MKSDITPSFKARDSCKIVVFDLDRTLVTCNSSYWFCTFLHRKKILSTTALFKAYLYRLRHDYFSMELEQLHNEVFRSLFQGFSLRVLEKNIESFIHKCILANLYFPAFQELRFAQHRGAYTVMMLSSPSFLVQRAALALGMDEWVATEYGLDASLRLASIQSIVDGQTKAKALQKLAEKRNVPLEQVAAYSDSCHDLPLLQLAGKPVAVNPDPQLRALSLKNKWPIL